jgi:hypothetical protein
VALVSVWVFNGSSPTRDKVVGDNIAFSCAASAALAKPNTLGRWSGQLVHHTPTSMRLAHRIHEHC